MSVSNGWASFVAIVIRAMSWTSGDRRSGRRVVVLVGRVWVMERRLARRWVAR